MHHHFTLRATLVIFTLLLAAKPGVLRAQRAAPDEFGVKLETSQGDVIIVVNRQSAPLGADRFHSAIKQGFYDDCRFFRVVPNFVVQFGINGDPKTQTKWREAKIKDDPVKVSNKRGTLTFATAGPGTRTTQMFINLGDNSRLDAMGFAPFGKVIKGMDVVDKLTSKYGQMPQQGQIQSEGNAYLKKNFPDMDFIKKATIVPLAK
ncbi:MAG: peptidylprolyl isomerase [Pirellulaceae bacterium]